MGRKVFHFAKLRSKVETNKCKHAKVAIFFLRVKNKISKEENSNKKEALSSIEERKQYFCVSQKRERKYLPKSFPSSPPFLSIFSITPLGVFLFVRLFVCLFVKCAYAREETCASSSLAGTCMHSKSTKRHKKGEKQQKTRASSSFAGTCMPLKSTKRHKKREKQQKTRARSSFAGTCTPSNGTKRHKKGEKQQKARASSSFAGTCMPSNCTKRHKKGENQQKTRASSSFAGTCRPSNSTKRHKKGEKRQKTRASSSFSGYSTSFRGTFSLFLARKTLKNDFTHWNIVQMKIFQGLYSRISRSKGGYSFSGSNSIFSLFKERFLFISPLLFDPSKTTFFRLCTIFIPPRNTSLLFTKHPPEEEKSTTKGEASTTHASKESYA